MLIKKEKSLRILLIVSAFNSLTQRIFCDLYDADHTISVALAINDESMHEATLKFNPDMVISPFLKKKIPSSVWNAIPTFIVHPGIIGDRGNDSLDFALLKGCDTWGVTIIRANEEYDAGDIYGSDNFVMRQAHKSSLYRNEVTKITSRLIMQLLKDFNGNNIISQKDIVLLNRNQITQKDRQINWDNDSSQDIIRKILASDSHPGVLDDILGVPCYLYGAHKESSLRGVIKEVLAKRDGAICLGTKDGAVWISHLMSPNSIKLPATYVLKDKLKGVKEDRIPLFVSPELITFKEISFFVRDEVGYLSFDFHNGAMSSQQCVRLKYAIEQVVQEDIKVLVLLGGSEFFSNGIHLNIMEDSKKSDEDGWSNIHSMNELVKSILLRDEVLVVSAMKRNAGAGGVFLALSADYVVARNGIVLNPHYRTLGLFGSEYWTYTLPKRVGKEIADMLTDQCLPVSAKRAYEISMVDVLLYDEEYDDKLHKFCVELYANDDKYHEQLHKKRDKILSDDFLDEIQKCRQKELEMMHDSFYDPHSDFNRLRKEFVYKLCPIRTPNHLKGVYVA